MQKLANLCELPLPITVRNSHGVDFETYDSFKQVLKLDCGLERERTLYRKFIELDANKDQAVRPFMSLSYASSVLAVEFRAWRP